MATNKPFDEKVTFSHSKGNASIFPGTFQSHYAIHFFLDGDTEFICSSLRKKLSPFDVVLIPAGEYHRFITHGDVSSHESCVLTISSPFLSEELLKEAFGNKRILRPDKNHRIIKNLLYLKDIKATHSAEDFSLVLPAIATDLIFLIKQSENTTLFEENGLQRLSANVMNYINEHYRSNLTLGKIAENFFISVSTACHYFKEDFGISIKQYLIEKKMYEAKVLVEKGYKAQDICEKLGFENYSTFFRAYRKHFGCSPSGRK